MLSLTNKLVIINNYENFDARYLYLRILGSDMMTMTYVFEVKTSIKAAKLEFRTSMLWNEAANLLQLNLNCLIMLLIFSNLCTSLWSLRWQYDIT